MPLAPLHQPHNLEPIRIVRRRLPEIPQVACFDTAFHQTQSDIAQHVRPAARNARARRAALRLPRAVLRLHRVRPERLRSRVSPKGRVIVAHLGNGASLCALEGRRQHCDDHGLLRSRRPADGNALRRRRCRRHLLHAAGDEAQSGGGRAHALHQVRASRRFRPVERHAGLARPMRQRTPDAKRAIELFVYRITREIGSLVAALGGIDGLVFTAGIGENDVGDPRRGGRRPRMGRPYPR